jgi:hypothetical protein
MGLPMTRKTGVHKGSEASINPWSKWVQPFPRVRLRLAPHGFNDTKAAIRVGGVNPIRSRRDIFRGLEARSLLGEENFQALTPRVIGRP